jgi:PAS domain S-box-containing protein
MLIKKSLQKSSGLSDIMNSDWLEQCVHHLNDAVLITEAGRSDEPGPRILWANDVFYTLTGYGPSEIIGQSPRILQGPLTDKSVLKTLRTALEKWEVCRVEVLNYKKDGSTFWNEFEVTPVANEDGHHTHWIAVQRDITKRKLAEKEQEEHRNHLEALVNERTHDLTAMNEALTSEIVKRKKVELELVDKEVNLEEAQRIAKLGSWQLDISSDKVVWSEGLFNMYGFDPKQPVPPYSEHHKLFTPESWDKLSTALSKTRETGIPYELELKTVRQDEKNGWMWVRGEAGLNAKGVIVTLHGVAQDITERKQAEEELRSKTDDFERIFNLSAYMVCIASPEGILKKVSPAFTETLGYSEKELLAKPFFEFVHPDDKNTTADKLAPLARGIPIIRYSKRYSCKDGSYKWLEWTGRSFVEGGDIYAIAYEVTERKQAEKALEEYHDHLEALVNERTHDLTTMNEALKSEIVKREKVELELVDKEVNLEEAQRIAKLGSWHLDIASDKVTWSEELFYMYGFNPTQPLPTYSEFHKLFTPESWDKLSSALSKTRDTGIPYELELETVRKDKKNGWMWARGETVCDAKGVIVTLHGVAQDITERKQLEQEINDANEEKYKRAGELVIANKELVDREANLAQANAGKSRFLAAASHDLRQPLQSLGMYFSVMTRQFDKPEPLDPQKLKEIGKKMRHSLNSMGELLAALLDISKLDGGSVIPEKRNVQLPELLDRIIIGNMQQAKNKGLQLVRTGEVCIVHSDPGLLERVIENFVTNAVRYTDHGSVTIHCKRVDDIVRISVMDTGVGIPEGEIDKVFEEYYQINNTARNRHLGLGLGLSIVKLIGGILEHPLSVSSTLSQGSTFAVDVPLSREIAAVKTLIPEKGIPGERNIVVLLVDDDPSILDATTMLLQSINMDVYSALDGDAAMAHLSAGVQPNIIVSDYRLPGYNGIEVIRRVRQITFNDLPAILITGDTKANEIFTANMSNCTVLHKPADVDQLIALIRKNHYLGVST